MNKLTANTISTKKITSKEISEMLALFNRYYDNIDPLKFKSDLLEKDNTIILRDSISKQIKGFSTIRDLEITIKGKKVVGIFSGDTVIDSNYWGQMALTMEFFFYLAKKRLMNPHREVYWFLISKGYKTYLLLTNNFETYYPRYDRPIDQKYKTIIDQFATILYQDVYDTESGLLKCANRYDRLKSHIAPLNPECLNDPNIKFFIHINPQWSLGEELCCIGRVDIGLAKKYLAKWTKRNLPKLTLKNSLKKKSL